MNLNKLTRQELSAKLAADTATFIEGGGVIEQIPYDPTAEIAAKVGYWTAMGQGEGTFEFPEWDSENWSELDDEDLEILDANEEEAYDGGIPEAY